MKRLARSWDAVVLHILISSTAASSAFWNNSKGTESGSYSNWKILRRTLSRRTRTGSSPFSPTRTARRPSIAVASSSSARRIEPASFRPRVRSRSTSARCLWASSRSVRTHLPNLRGERPSHKEAEGIAEDPGLPTATSSCSPWASSSQRSSSPSGV